MSSDLQLHYAATGSGPPVCLIHAFPMNRTMWKAEISALSDRYTIFAPDLPGFGQSPVSPGWRIEAVADNIIRTANANGFGDFGVIGLSMGTYAAFEIHRQAPGRVRFLVLANGRARADSAEERASRTALIDAVGERGLVALSDAVLPRLLGERPSSAFRETVQRAIDAGTVEGVSHAIEALRDRRDSAVMLGDIRCPTLVIAGGRDPITPSAECQELAHAIDGARFREIPEAGHLSNLENPEEFRRTLEAFLPE